MKKRLLITSLGFLYILFIFGCNNTFESISIPTSTIESSSSSNSDSTSSSSSSSSITSSTSSSSLESGKFLDWPGSTKDYAKYRNYSLDKTKDKVYYLGEGLQQTLSVTFLELYSNASTPKQTCADSIYISYGDVDIVIDAGTDSCGAGTVVPFLKEQVKDKKIELIIGTHSDADHIGGFVGTSAGRVFDIPDFLYENILDFGENKSTNLYGNYLTNIGRLTEHQGTNYWSIHEAFDESLPIAKAFYLSEDTMIYLLDARVVSSDPNDQSVCTLIVNGENTYLLTGDAESKQEAKLTPVVKEWMTKLDIDAIDVFKANHHGSETSNTKALLDVIKPSNVVICSSKDNSYKIPKKSVVTRFLQYTPNVFATFLSGHITYQSIEGLNEVTYFACLLRDYGFVNKIVALVPIKETDCQA